MFFVKTEIARAGILHLLIDDDRANDKSHGDGELGNDEPFPDKAGSCVHLYTQSLEHRNGLKGGQVKRRIAAGDKTAKEADNEQRGKMDGSKGNERQLFPDEGVEARQGDVYQDYRQRYGQKGHQEGFEDE